MSFVILDLAVPDTIAGSYREGRLCYRVFPRPYGQQQLPQFTLAARNLQCASLQVSCTLEISNASNLLIAF